MATSGTALILPEVVAKGAYEAGVLSVLAECEVPVDRLVAASSGSLNAVVCAAGIRAGRGAVRAPVTLRIGIQFSEFLSRELRACYVEVGRKSAEAIFFRKAGVDRPWVCAAEGRSLRVFRERGAACRRGLAHFLFLARRK